MSTLGNSEKSALRPTSRETTLVGYAPAPLPILESVPMPESAQIPSRDEPVVAAEARPPLAPAPTSTTRADRRNPQSRREPINRGRHLSRRFFEEGERQQRNGWEDVSVPDEVDAVDRALHFDSFDRVPSRRTTGIALSIVAGAAVISLAVWGLGLPSSLSSSAGAGAVADKPPATHAVNTISAMPVSPRAVVEAHAAQIDEVPAAVNAGSVVTESTAPSDPVQSLISTRSTSSATARPEGGLSKNDLNAADTAHRRPIGRPPQRKIIVAPHAPARSMTRTKPAHAIPARKAAAASPAAASLSPSQALAFPSDQVALPPSGPAPAVAATAPSAPSTAPEEAPAASNPVIAPETIDDPTATAPGSAAETHTQ